MNAKRILISPIFTFALLACGVFAFFFFVLPFHLYHREQISLFLCNSAFVMPYFQHTAGISALIGDFLTQFFYYIGIAPLIISLIVLGIGLATYHAAKLLQMPHIVAHIVGALTLIWEALRHTYFLYPLSSSVAVLIALLLTLLYPTQATIRTRTICAIALLALGIWLTGYPTWILCFFILIIEIKHRSFPTIATCAIAIFVIPTQTPQYANLIAWPNLQLEQQFATDTKYYWNPSDTSIVGNNNSTVGQYYQFLTSCSTANGFDAFLNTRTLRQTAILPVDENSNYFNITAAGEAWFRMGDMTMAEHATMLGMIFSPYHHGTRHLRRLAEINMIVGDNDATQKYLSILRQTIVHAKWAKQHQHLNAYLAYIASMQPTTDTIRYTTDFRRSLRNLLCANANNTLARNYLFFTLLKNKDIIAFATDVDKYAPQLPLNNTMAEAYIAALASMTNADRQLHNPNRVPTEVYNRFVQFNNLYTKRDSVALRANFANSYWFYYKFHNVR